MSRLFQTKMPSALRTAATSNAVRRWKSSLHHLSQQRQQQRWHLLASQTGATSAFGGVLSVGANCLKSSSSSSLPPFSSTLRLLSTTSTSSFSSSFVPSRSSSIYSETNRSNRSTYSKRNMCSNIEKCLSLENINPYFVEMEYAVRGPVVIRAAEIEKEIANGEEKPFPNVIRANIGDCHAMGQVPITFLRQMLSACYNPALFYSCEVPEDVKEKAKTILNGCAGKSAGSYTESIGLEVVRRQVADFIAARDGHRSDYTKIILTGGASPAIKRILGLLNCTINGKKAGVMTPIPQYPLYSATLAEFGMKAIGYYLDEDNNWGLDINELRRALEEARKSYTPRGIVIINPGNPTGQVLSLQNIEDVIKFAFEEKLVVLADEVYQYNIYDPDSKFYSFKKVMMEMGAPYNQLELVSFNSASKGFLGECGVRGGYMEVVNMCPKVYAMLLKSITASLCSTTAGQIAISALVNPPKEGEPSYELYMIERTNILKSLAKRATLVYETFNKFEGFACNTVQGAMYAFPQITIPPKAVEEAKKLKMAPDLFYVFELLNATGVCVVPGSGFMQKPGTYHFRTTILPPTDLLEEMLQRFQDFHISFMEKYQ